VEKARVSTLETRLNNEFDAETAVRTLQATVSDLVTQNTYLRGVTSGLQTELLAVKSQAESLNGSIDLLRAHPPFPEGSTRRTSGVRGAETNARYERELLEAHHSAAIVKCSTQAAADVAASSQAADLRISEAALKASEAACQELRKANRERGRKASRDYRPVSSSSASSSSDSSSSERERRKKPKGRSGSGARGKKEKKDKQEQKDIKGKKEKKDKKDKKAKKGKKENKDKKEENKDKKKTEPLQKEKKEEEKKVSSSSDSDSSSSSGASQGGLKRRKEEEAKVSGSKGGSSE
jgi:hypothetical protein